MTDGKSSHGRFAVIPPAPHVTLKRPKGVVWDMPVNDSRASENAPDFSKTETYSASAFPAWNGEFTQLGIERRDFHMQQGRCSVFAAHAPPRHRHDLTQVPFFQLFQCRRVRKDAAVPRLTGEKWLRVRMVEMKMQRRALLAQNYRPLDDVFNSRTFPGQE